MFGRERVGLAERRGTAVRRGMGPVLAALVALALLCSIVVTPASPGSARPLGAPGSPSDTGGPAGDFNLQTGGAGPAARPLPTVGLGAGYVFITNQSGSVTAAFDDYEVPSVTCYTAANTTHPKAPVSRPLASQGAPLGVALYGGAVDFSAFRAYELGVEPLCPDFFQNPVYVPLYFSITVSSSTKADPLGFDSSWFAFPNFVVHAGDSMRSAMVSSTSQLTLSLRDVTAHEVATKTITARGFAPNGAACLIVQFNNVAKFDRTVQHCTATVEGKTAGIGDFGGEGTLYRGVLTGPHGNTAAVASRLTSDGATYADTWVSSRPYEIEHPHLLDQRFSPGFAGYLLLNNHTAPVRAVSDSYTQPKATCNNGEKLSPPKGGFYPGDATSFLGSGLYAGDVNLSNYAFYAVGTQAYCPEFFQNPTYVANYLVGVVTPQHPEGAFTMVGLPGVTVHPGDSIRAIVEETSNHIRFVLTDATTETTVYATIFVPGVATNGAACVTEPFGNLDQFSTTEQICRATVGHLTRGIGDFPAPNVLYRFDLVALGGAVQASTAALGCDGEAFSVTWVTSQPLFYEP